MPALRKRTRVCFPFVGDSLGGSHMSTLLLIEGLARSRYEPVLVVHEEGPLTAHLKARDIHDPSNCCRCQPTREKRPM